MAAGDDSPVDLPLASPRRRLRSHDERLVARGEDGGLHAGRDSPRPHLRSGLTPIVTLYGLDLGILLGGSVVMERIFNIPGLGNLLLQSRDFSDFPLMAGIVVVASVGVMIGSLLVDIAYAILDPRLRSPTRVR